MHYRSAIRGIPPTATLHLTHHCHRRRNCDGCARRHQSSEVTVIDVVSSLSSASRTFTPCPVLSGTVPPMRSVHVCVCTAHGRNSTHVHAAAVFLLRSCVMNPDVHLLGTSGSVFEWSRVSPCQSVAQEEIDVDIISETSGISLYLERKSGRRFTSLEISTVWAHCSIRDIWNNSFNLFEV